MSEVTANGSEMKLVLSLRLVEATSPWGRRGKGAAHSVLAQCSRSHKGRSNGGLGRTIENRDLGSTTCRVLFLNKAGANSNDTFADPRLDICSRPMLDKRPAPRRTQHKQSFIKLPRLSAKVRGADYQGECEEA